MEPHQQNAPEREAAEEAGGDVSRRRAAAALLLDVRDHPAWRPRSAALVSTSRQRGADAPPSVYSTPSYTSAQRARRCTSLMRMIGPYFGPSVSASGGA
jgi:hypothetical protein